MSLEKDLINYETDLKIVKSHLNAAMSAVAGLYARNPETHRVPGMDGLMTDIASIRDQPTNAIHTSEDRRSEQ